MSIFSKIFDTAKDVFSGGFGSVVSGGLDLLGGVMSNNANASQVRQNRAFQADQTGTAYQRAVADLKSAGLNPMLAYTNGGASSGGGAQSTMQNVVGSSVSTANSAARNKAEIDNMRQTNDLIMAQKIQSLSASDLNNAQASKAVAEARLAEATTSKVTTDNILSNAAVAGARNASNAESSWIGKGGAYFDRLMKSVNHLPILNWFNSK